MEQLRARPDAERHRRAVHGDDDLSTPAQLSIVGEEDLEDLLPLVRAYCDFYEVAPADADLLSLSRALIADAEREGTQIIARDWRGRAIGFATIFWSWSTLGARRLGVMNDLYVAEHARGSGVAEALIEACRVQCRSRGVPRLAWQTAKDNLRAQKLYDRIGGERSEWLDYDVPTEG